MIKQNSQENIIDENVSSLKIKVYGYDVKTVEEAISKIISQVIKIGLKFSGVIYLPVKRELVTVLRSPHKHSSSREQFERRTHKRLFYVFNVKKTHFGYFSNLQLPHSVEVRIENKDKR